MLTYCLVCRNYTENKDAKMMRTKNGRLVLLSKCSKCGNKKLKFMKEQEAEGSLSNLEFRTPLSKIPLLNVALSYKMNDMNKVVDKFLKIGNRFMPEMHLRFTYSACGPFTKNKQRTQKFMETGDTKYIYRNELDQACFQHDMVYNFKDFKRRTYSDKFFKIKLLKLQAIQNMMDIKED